MGEGMAANTILFHAPTKSYAEQLFSEHLHTVISYEWSHIIAHALLLQTGPSIAHKAHYRSHALLSPTCPIIAQRSF